jgi:hypothetical protein
MNIAIKDAITPPCIASPDKPINLPFLNPKNSAKELNSLILNKKYHNLAPIIAIGTIIITPYDMNDEDNPNLFPSLTPEI